MAKKSFVSDQQKQQASSMSAPHAIIISDTSAKVTQISALSDEDDDDDICPVCESECTCRNKTNVNPTQNAPPRTVQSISSFDHSSLPASASQSSLKIKLTLPSHLRARQPGPYVPEVDTHPQGPADDVGSSVLVAGVGQAPPRRPGRPPKTLRKVSTGWGTSQTDHTMDPSSSSRSKLTRPVPVGRAPQVKRRKVKRAGASQYPGRATDAYRPHGTGSTIVEDSDSLDDISDIFPTFMSAASISSRSTSSDSSSSDSSDLSEDEAHIDENAADNGARNQRRKFRGKQDIPGEDTGRRRRDQILNRWEIRPRRTSVGPDEHSGGTEGSSDDEGAIAENEDEDEDEDEDSEDGDEGDVEGGGDVENEGLMDPDDDEDGAELSSDGKLGVSFGGVATGWSEDEESSFDADLFFANLDGSSDSDSASTPSPSGMQLSDEDSDKDNTASFSADEDDALFLMDVDPSTHVRRDRGEFEFGVALSGLSSAWDDPFRVSYAGSPDVEMSVDDSSESTHEDSPKEPSDSGIVLDETDGETTEDELVDDNGLPNPRAMMLFRWPAAMSTVDPLSTMSPPASFTPPANATQSVRIALASYSAYRSSPPPTPADILAGKLSIDDYEELDGRHPGPRHKRAMMGQFSPVTEPACTFAIVDGSGAELSTPFPRTQLRNRVRSDDSPAAHRSPASDDDPESPIRARTRRSFSDLQLASSGEGERTPSHSQSAHSQSEEDMSSADPIDLDDVLDATFLGTESPTFALERLVELPSRLASSDLGLHVQSLSRWDRIPVAAFRQTQETATLETAGSDSTMNTPMGSRTLLGDGKSRGTHKGNSSQRKPPKQQLHKFMVSPVLFPTQDVSPKTPTLSAGSSQNSRSHRNKTKRDPRKDLAHLKKSNTKVPLRKSQLHRHHNHHHYPNSKFRSSSSAQRSNNFGGSGSSIPHLNL